MSMEWLDSMTANMVGTLFAAAFGAAYAKRKLSKGLNKVTVEVVKGEVGLELKFSLPEGMKNCYVSSVSEGKVRNIGKTVSNDQTVSLVRNFGFVYIKSQKWVPSFLEKSITFGPQFKNGDKGNLGWRNLWQKKKVAKELRRFSSMVNPSAPISLSISHLSPSISIEHQYETTEGIVEFYEKSFEIGFDSNNAFQIYEILGDFSLDPPRKLEITKSQLLKIASYLGGPTVRKAVRMSIDQPTPRQKLISLRQMFHKTNWENQAWPPYNRMPEDEFERKLSARINLSGKKKAIEFSFPDSILANISPRVTDFHITSPFPIASDELGELYVAAVRGNFTGGTRVVDFYLGRDGLLAWRIYGEVHGFNCTPEEKADLERILASARNSPNDWELS